MNNKKVELGQFFTRNDIWLRPQVKDFILKSGCSIAYDPFAGDGDLLNAVSIFKNIKSSIGYDIDTSLTWKINDSLVHIPHIDDAIIITNPPYLAKQSASRKNIDYSIYFDSSPYIDLYLIALDRMLEAQKYVVAIIPESFINSSFRQKNLLSSITILEENPFLDTENPVCVVCFDGVPKDLSNVKIYKNDEYINNLNDILSIRLKPYKDLKVRFNDLSGWLGLRAVDSTNDSVKIHFDFKENIKYDWEHNIKVTSRHMTLISIDVPEKDRQDFINNANEIINDIRFRSADVLLTPFKGNTRNGVRRRRLDFDLARAILEETYFKMYGSSRLV